jgi:hypothetical protein
MINYVFPFNYNNEPVISITLEGDLAAQLFYITLARGVQHMFVKKSSEVYFLYYSFVDSIVVLNHRCIILYLYET